MKTPSLLGVLLLIALGGCSGSAAIEPFDPPRTALALNVSWPDISRATPRASRSVLVNIVQGNLHLQQQLVRNVDTAYRASIVFEEVEAGPVSVNAQALPNVDDSGVPQGRADFVVEVLPTQVTSVELALDSTITSLELTPADIDVSVAREVQIRAVPRDSLGRFVITQGTAPGAEDLEFRIEDPSIARIEWTDGYNGTLYGLASGTTRLIATVKDIPSGSPTDSVLINVDRREWTMLSEFSVAGATAVTQEASGGFTVARSLGGDEWIEQFTAAGVSLRRWGSRGSAQGQFNGIVDLDVDRFGNVYALERSNHRVQKFSPTGTFLLEFGADRLTDPQHFSINPDELFVADTDGVKAFGLNGVFARSGGEPAANMTGLFADRRDFLIAMSLETDHAKARIYWTADLVPTGTNELMPAPSAPGRFRFTGEYTVAYPEAGFVRLEHPGSITSQFGTPSTMRPIDLSPGQPFEIWVVSARPGFAETIQRWRDDR
ncbi:MAG: hypothetical protein ACAH95_18410 [Fimbriimonas sp.]